MSNRYTAVAKFVGSLVNVVVTDTRPEFTSAQTVYSYTQVENAGTRHFMRDGGGWTFLPHGSEIADAVIAAARPLLAQNRVVDRRTQDLASLRHMIRQQLVYVRNAPGEKSRALCLGTLREFLARRAVLMVA